jgi:hypothetical protein
MNREVRRAGRPLPRLARLLAGRNELRRPSDRIEGAVLVALSAAFLTAAVMAALLAVHIYQSQRATAAGLRPAVAVLSQPGPVAGSAVEPSAQAQARWRLPDGTERSGLLTTLTAPAIYDAPAGTSVQVWLDRSGRPQPPPPGQRDIILNALIAGISITAGAALLLILCYLLCRLALDRHRLARWGSAWTATGPRWTSSR